MVVISCGFTTSWLKLGQKLNANFWEKMCIFFFVTIQMPLKVPKPGSNSYLSNSNSITLVNRCLNLRLAEQNNLSIKTLLSAIQVKYMKWSCTRENFTNTKFCGPIVVLPYVGATHIYRVNILWTLLLKLKNKHFCYLLSFYFHAE